MLNMFFQGLFNSTSIQPSQFLLCLLTALILGVFLVLIYTRQRRYSSSFLVTLAILPAIVCVIIMLVNGNIGASHCSR